MLVLVAQIDFMKQFSIFAKDLRETVLGNPSVVEWIRFVEGVTQFRFSDEDKAAMLSCGQYGYVDGAANGAWSSGISKNKHHVQYHPFGCNVPLCPNCVERAVKRLASHALYRWTNLYELARRQLACDSVVVTIPRSWRSIVSSDKAKFQAVVAESLNDCYYVGSTEELFLESVVQDWGESDLSGEPVVHCHVLLSNLVFDRVTHLVTAELPVVGRLVSESVLRRWRMRFLSVFNYRMRIAFPSLPLSEADNVWRGFISQDVSGIKIASAKLRHALNYNYRSVVQDLVKWVVHNGIQFDARFFNWSKHYGTLTDSGVLNETRCRRIAEMLSRTELDADKSGKSSALRYERVRGFGAASKSKVGRVMKALASVPPSVSFV